LIFCSFDYTPELIQAIKDTGLPAAITSFYENSGSDRFYDCIYASQPRAAWCATKHCIEMGHTRIAFLGGDPKEQNTRERFEGYRQAMEEAGLAVEMDLVIYADFTRAGASHQFQQFIMENGQCTAVVACNDLMAIGCMNACGTLGLKVPENISIVSLDNTEYCLCTNPLITSVDMMQNQVGTEAVKLIMDRIINKRCYRKDLVFSPNIIRRDSVKQLMPMKK
ncbi:MAG: substrate-binding domain-containing protein, partial [Oscillospiraceae bacterium]